MHDESHPLALKRRATPLSQRHWGDDVAQGVSRAEPAGWQPPQGREKERNVVEDSLRCENGAEGLDGGKRGEGG